MNNDYNLSYFFDQSGKNYDPPLEEMKELIAIFLTPEIVKDKIILDAGCGIGLASVIFDLWGAKNITGLDISPDSIKKAQELKEKYQSSKINFEVADLDKIILPKNYFDFVFSRGVSFYMADLKKYLNKLASTVKPSGFVIIDFVKTSHLIYLTERIRIIFQIIPNRYKKNISKTLSFMAYPIIKKILGKKAKLNGGKTVEQMFYEHFFSPVSMKTTTINEIKEMLGNDYSVIDLNVPNIGLHSPKTSFYLKITNKNNENTPNQS